MEFFSDEQCQQSLMNSVCLPDTPAYVPFSLQGKTEEMSDEFFFFPSCFSQLESFPSGSASLLTETFSSTTVKPEECCGKKREQANFSCQSTAQSKSKRRRPKNSSSGKKKMEEKQPPTDYIHVRARRGQATDSHSLAERVRRERISERMKVLQGLVPGCEKVTGKAPILDEIINYVESLKNQVEFLSMKLASVSPILFEFGFHFENLISIPAEIVNDDPQLLPSMMQSRDIQSPSDSFTVMSAASNPLLPVQGITAFPQDDGSFLMQDEELDFQADLYSMYSFQ